MSSMSSLDNHLCDALSTKRLAAHKLLLFQSSECVACSSEGQHNGGCNQAAGINYDAQPLDQGHDTVDAGSHVVCREATDESVEFGRGGADA